MSKSLIAGFNPYSIQTIDDVVKMLDLILEDVLCDIGSRQSRSGNTLTFGFDDPCGDLLVDITVRDSHKAARSAPYRRKVAPLLEAFDASGLTVAEAIECISPESRPIKPAVYSEPDPELPRGEAIE